MVLFAPPRAQSALSAVGAVDPTTHYPTYYEDSNGLRLDLCLDGLPNCFANLPELQGAGGEAFYWLGDAAGGAFTIPGGSDGLSVIRFATEAASFGGTPGEESAFDRVRIRLNVPGPGTYTVVHPFGTKTYNNVTIIPGGFDINDTLDVGCFGQPGINTCNDGLFPDFGAVLPGPIGPFLRWDPAFAPAPPPGFIGDNATPHRVVGSAIIDGLGNPQNYVEIIKIGPPDTVVFRSDLFSIQGKIGSGLARPALTAASDTGASATDGITNNTAPTVTGIADPNLTIRLYVDGVFNNSGTSAVGSGAYSIPAVGPLAEGVHRITVTQMAGAPAVESAPSPAFSITIDTIAPAAPAVPDLAAASDSGAFNSDNITNVKTPIFTGLSETGSRVDLFVDAGVLSSGNGLAASGTYSIATGTLADGARSISAQATDVAGNIGAASAALSVTIDSIAPAAPPAVDLLAASDSGAFNNDNITNVVAPDFTGSAETGSSVTLFSNGTSKGVASAGAGSFTITSSILSEGLNAMTVKALDVAGNLSNASSALNVTIDTQVAVPSVPDLAPGSDSGSSNSDNVTNVTTPTFNGSAEAGSSVSINVDGSQTGAGTATAGSYSVASSLLGQGTHSVTSRTVDLAGNVSGISSGLSFVIDTAAPAQPQVPDLDALSDSGASSTDNITSIANPRFTGTAEAGSSVDIRANGGSSGTGTSVGGSYSIVAGPLAEGVFTMTARATDVAGNASIASGGLSVTIDHTSPAAPSIPDLDAASDSGVSNSDNITNDTTPTFVGSAEAGSSVRILADSILKGSGPSNGSYSITTGVLASGSIAIAAETVDLAGNQSIPSGSLLISIDTVAPGAPSVPDLLAASDSGASNSDNITNDSTPSFSGSAESGSIVTIFSNFVSRGSGIAPGGSYSITTSALSEGAQSVSASATDIAGNEGSLSSSLSVTLDLTAPAAPLVSASTPGSPANNNGPRINGAAEVGASVRLFTNLSCSSAVAASGSASDYGSLGVLVSVADNTSTSFFARATDVAGNDSGCSLDPFVYVEDSLAPVAPSAPDLAAGSDSGASNTDDLTNDDTPTFNGSAESGSTVRIFVDGVQKGSGNASAGSYSITTTPLLEGAHSITATATDAANNLSVLSGSLSMTIDLSAPARPAVSSSSPLSPANNNSPRIIGSAEAGSSVNLYSNSSCSSSVAGSGSAASYASPGLSVSVADNTSPSFFARATDPAGNVGACSFESVQYIEDSAAPAAPTVPDMDPASDTGSSSIDNITGDTTPTFNGSAEAGSSVELFVGGVLKGSGTAVLGSWSITVSPALSVGTHSVTARATDSAGNVGVLSGALSITILAAPAQPAATDLVTDSGSSPSDNITNDSTPTFNGSAEAGSNVQVYVDGSVKGNGPATGGNYSITTSSLVDGIHTVNVSATNAAGIESGQSAPLTVTIDTVAPTAPSAPDLDAASDTGASNSDNVTKNATPSFSGNAEAGSSVTIFSDTFAKGSGLASGGAYSVTASALANGGHAISANATDVAGNPSGQSAGLSVTIDLVAPGAPAVSASNPASPANNNSPNIVGSAEAGSSVRLFTNSSCTSAQAGSGSAANYASPGIAVSVADNSSTIFFGIATDLAGNDSACSAGLSYVEDSLAPAAPSVPDLAAASDSGASSTDDLTNDETPTISGSAEPGSTVKIFSNGILKGSGVATGGSYSVTVSALGEGLHSLRATATDAAGNVSSNSGILDITVDLTAPARPAVSFSSPLSPANNNSPRIIGSAEAGSSVSLFTNSSCSSAVAGSGSAASYASPGISVSVADNSSLSFFARARDLAGNDGVCSLDSVQYVEDSAAPAAPTVPDMDPASDTGSSSTDNVTGDATPTFNGNAEAGSSVELFVDGILKGSVTAGAGAGPWSITVSAPALSVGTHSVTAKATDSAGNVGVLSGALSISIQAAPAQPAATDLVTDSGSSPSDNITNNSTPTFSGSAEAGSTVKVYVDGVVKGSGTATGGNYSVTTSVLSEGLRSVEVSATNLAGAESGRSVPLSITIDTIAPATPGAPDLDVASDSGVSSSDDITNDATPSFNGNAENGATVSLRVDSVEKGSGAAGGGSYSITSTLLSEGARSVAVRATDVAGNASIPSAPLALTIDVSAPAAPTVPQLAAASDSGVSASDKLTNDATPSFAGSAEAGANISLFADGAKVAGGPAGADGSYALTSSLLADGLHAVSAGASDLAGNASAGSGSSSVRIDTQAPAAPSTPDLTPASDTGPSNSDNITSDVTPSFGGSAEAAASIALLVDGTSNGSAQVAAGGGYSVTAAQLASGVHSISVRGSDAAGNVGSVSAALRVTIVGHPGAPALRSSSALTLKPLRGSAGGPGGALAVGGRFSVDEAVKLRLSVLSPTGQSLPLLAGSRLAAFRATFQLKALASTLNRPGQVAFSLRLPLAKLIRGVRYQIVIKATDPDGQSRVLRLPFKRS